MNNTCYALRYSSFHQLPSFRLTLSALFGITSLTAVSLNSLILYSIWKNPTLHKPSYLLLANLALSDLLYGAFGGPSLIVFHYAYIQEWVTISCYMSAISFFIGYWLAAESVYLLTVISIDRLLAIRLKNRYRSFVTSRRIWMVTIPYWVGMLVVLLALFLSNVWKPGIYLLAPFLLFISLTTITVCYSMSFYLLKKLTSSVSSSSSQQPDNGSSNFDVSQYRRSMNTMILVMVTTLLLYLPYLCSVVVHSIVNKKGEISSIPIFKAYKIGELITALNPIVNPLLYLWRMQDIRQPVKTTVRRILRREHHSVQDEQT